MPKRPKKKTSPTPTSARSGPKKPLLRYLERAAKLGFTRKHACAFCGREGFAPTATHVGARLFCDRACFALHRYYLHSTAISAA